MPLWLIDIYILLTSRVPVPRMLVLFATVTLACYTVLASRTLLFLEMGVLVSVLSMMAGHLAVTFVKLPETIDRLTSAGWANPERRLFAIYMAGYATVIWLPSVELAQTALTIAIAIYLTVFVGLTLLCNGAKDLPWFAQTWDTGRRNAANWHIARMTALILLNEMVSKFGNPTDWVVAITLGPLALHYLMHWTILATHPHEGRSPLDD